MMKRNDSADPKASAAPDKILVGKNLQETSNSTNLPTPPYSSACSLLLQREADDAELGSSPAKMGASVLAAVKNYFAPPGNTPSPPSARRHTSHPISSITDHSVFASHFSNPSLSHTLDGLPDTSHPDQQNPPVSASSENLNKLTGNAANGSRVKNTPPLTPRAMSNEAPHVDKKAVTSSPASVTPSHRHPDDLSRSTDEIAGRLKDAFPRTSSSSPSGGLPGCSQKGTLRVKIAEARGLRPSFDPYVVCVFEWNEFISKSAKDEEADSLERQKSEENAEIDAGRPMAIPMKSRQSSNNSLLEGDPDRKMPVTDPHWNHEAVLYVKRLVKVTVC